MNKEQKEAYLIGLILKDTLAKAPPEVQAKVNEAVEKIRRAVAEAGEFGVVAVSLVAAEMGAKE